MDMKHLHHLRHTGLSLAAAAGAPISTLMATPGTRRRMLQSATSTPWTALMLRSLLVSASGRRQTKDTSTSVKTRCHHAVGRAIGRIFGQIAIHTPRQRRKHHEFSGVGLSVQFAYLSNVEADEEGSG